MDEYTSNSHKSREPSKEPVEKKKFEKVISGKATTKKRNGIIDAFVSDDASTIKSHILMDVLVPVIKKAVSEIFHDGIDIIFGESGHSTRSSLASKISYHGYYDRANDFVRSAVTTPRTRNVYSYDEISIPTRGEAEEVLARLHEAIIQYKMVSVADLYDMVGLNSSYTDNKYGWTDLRSAYADRTFDGQYKLRLPRAIPID